jgi:hypothetical protein
MTGCMMQKQHVIQRSGILKKQLKQLAACDNNQPASNRKELPVADTSCYFLLL